MKKIFMLIIALVGMNLAYQGMAQLCVGTEYKFSYTNRTKFKFPAFTNSTSCPQFPRYFKQIHIVDEARYTSSITNECGDGYQSYGYWSILTGVYSNQSNYYVTSYSGSYTRLYEPNAPLGGAIRLSGTGYVDDYDTMWSVIVCDNLDDWLECGPMDNCETNFQSEIYSPTDIVRYTNTIARTPTTMVIFGGYDSGNSDDEVWTNATSYELSDEYITSDLLTSFYSPTNYFGGLLDASAEIDTNQTWANLTGARVKFQIQGLHGRFTIPYRLSVDVGGKHLVATNHIEGYGNGTAKYYPEVKPIQIHPPYVVATNGEGCTYFVGGTAYITLLDFIDVLDGKDKGRHPIRNCNVFSGSFDPDELTTKDYTREINGMPRWWVSEPYINLWAADRPVEYQTSLGEKLGFSVSYKQHDTRLAAVEDHVPYLPSTGWNNNWSSFVHFTGQLTNFDRVFTNWTATVYERNGGESYYAAGQNLDAQTGDRLLPMDGINADVYPGVSGVPAGGPNVYGKMGFRLVHSDGSQDLYGIVTPLYDTNVVVEVPIYEDGTDGGLIPYVNSPLGMEYAGADYEYYTPAQVGTGGGTVSGGIGPTFTLSHLFVATNWSASVVDGHYVYMTVTNPAAPSADALLTEHIDPYGNSVHVYYTNNATGQYFVSSIVDYDGNTTTVGYDTNWMLSTVTMPYSRTATFHCNTNGMITNIVDAQGMSSSFSYGPDASMTSMITPYGTNSFDYWETNGASLVKGNDGLTRAIRITNPDNSHELYALFNKATNSMPAVYAGAVPPDTGLDVGDSGDETSALYRRNTFYWGRQQCSMLSTLDPASLNSLTTNDFILGQMTHWLLSADGFELSGAPSFVREPSPDGVIPRQIIWYDYSSKSHTWQLSDDDEKPVRMLELLPDGTSRYKNMSYGSDSQLTGVTLARYSAGGSLLDSQILRTLTYANGIVYSNHCIAGGTDYGSTAWTVNVLSGIAGPDIHGIDLSLSPDPGSSSSQRSSTTETVSVPGGSASTVVLTCPRRFPMTITDVGGNQTTIYFNNRQQVTGMHLPVGLDITNIYGVDGFLSKSIALQIHATNTYTFANGLLSSRVDPLGLATGYSWDDLNRLTGISFPDGSTISNRYTRLDLSAQKDRLGIWAGSFFDSMQRRLAFTNRNGGVTYFGYCPCGALESITDPLMNSTTLDRDYESRVKTVTFSDSGAHQIVRNLVYDPVGRVTNVTESGGLNITYKYDWLDRITNVTSSGGNVLYAVTYDSNNRPLSVKNAEGIGVTNTYDSLERITRQDWAEGISSQNHYSGVLLDYTTDGLSRQTHYGYNEAGWIISLTDANGNTNGYTYNPLGEILTLADGNAHTRSWTHDIYGRNTSKTEANSVLVSTNGYNADGWLTARWTPAKGLTRYTRDNNGNLTAIKYQQGTNTYSFDALNRIVSMNDAVGATAFTYKNFGAFMGAISTEDGPWGSDTVTHTFTNFLPASVSMPGWSETYGYDSLQRLTSVVSGAGTFTYAYNGVGRQVSSLSLPGSSLIGYTYDNAGDLLATTLTHGGSTLDAATYVYDGNGNRTSVTRADNAYVNYGYDLIGQLTGAVGHESGGATRHNENFGYGYDLAGNLLNRTNDVLTESFGIDSANELTTLFRTNVMTVAGGLTNSPSSVAINSQSASIYGDSTFAVPNVSLKNGDNTFTNVVTISGTPYTNKTTLDLPSSISFSYDANGNLTSDGYKSYDYDCANQLTSVSVSGQWKEQFSYDGFGRRRVRKDYIWYAGNWLQTSEVHYIYDGMLVIQELHFDAQHPTQPPTTVSYTRGIDLSSSLQDAGGIGGLLARTDSNDSAFYHSDGNGNVTAMVNSSGSVVAKYLYDPFGNTIAKSGPLADINLYRFSSKEMDSRSGLYYYGYRYYEPNLQRWINRDPIQEEGGINLYRFVANNPISLIDPLGLISYVGFNVYGWAGYGHVGLITHDPDTGLYTDFEHAHGIVYQKSGPDYRALAKGYDVLFAIPDRYDRALDDARKNFKKKPGGSTISNNCRTSVRDIMDAANVPKPYDGGISPNSWLNGFLRSDYSLQVLTSRGQDYVKPFLNHQPDNGSLFDFSSAY